MIDDGIIGQARSRKEHLQNAKITILKFPPFLRKAKIEMKRFSLMTTHLK